MPTNPNILSFLDSYKTYCTDNATKRTGGEQSYLVFPPQLETDEAGFVHGAAVTYRDTLVKAKMEQDPRKLIPDGNSYYFIRALAKAHRMYRRSRITNACINLSEVAGMSGGAFIDNLKQLGTVDITPTLGGAKK